MISSLTVWEACTDSAAIFSRASTGGSKIAIEIESRVGDILHHCVDEKRSFHFKAGSSPIDLVLPDLCSGCSPNARPR